jgi:drug/metabolite transporter (DMT)-like permease
MDWFLLSFISSMGMGLVSVLDKRLLDAHFPSVRSLTLMIGIVWSAKGIVILAVGLLVFGMPHLGYMGLAWLTGAIMGLGLAFYFWGLTFEEVSRASPIFGTSPLFAALLAVLFLSEELAGIQWSGMLAIVLGAALLSFRPTAGHKKFIGVKSLGIFFVAALLAGSALVLNKQAASGLSVWALFGCYAFGIGFSLAIISLRPTVFRQVASVVRVPAAIRLFLITELALAGLAILLLQIALKLGPVSVIGGIIASRSLFVLIYSSLLSTPFWNVLNEPLDRQTLALKSFSTVLIVVGLVALTVY